MSTPGYIEIPDREVNDACWLVSRWSIVPQLERELTNRTGRPHANPVRAMLALAIISADHFGGAKMHLSDWVNVAEALTPQQRQRIGLKAPVSLHQASRLVTQITRRAHGCDHEGVALENAFSFGTDRLHQSLIDASIPESVRPSTEYAIDATDQPAWATWTRAAQFCPDGRRSHKRCNHRMSADPDATIGYRTASQDQNPLFLGYHAHLATDVRPVGAEHHAPPFVRALSLVPANSSSATNGLAVVDMLRMTHRVTHVLSDRGYTPAIVDKWARPLRERGVSQSLDLKEVQKKRSPGPASLPQTVFIAGTLFPEGLPLRLRDIERPHFAAESGLRAAARELFDERAQFAFLPFTTPTADGRVRFRGPAAKGHERVKCVNWPHSLRVRANLPMTTCTPGNGCSCGRTATLRDEGLQLRQRHVWGSSDWEADYGRRSAIETTNSTLKTHVSHITRDSIRLMGLAKVSFAYAILIAVTNMRLFRSRYDVKPSDPNLPDAILPAPRRRNRKRGSRPAGVVSTQSRPRQQTVGPAGTFSPPPVPRTS